MWELVELEANGNHTDRMKVRDGWIVRTIIRGAHVGMVFVSDPNNAWKLDTKKR